MKKITTHFALYTKFSLLLLSTIMLSACVGNAATESADEVSVVVKTKELSASDVIRMHDIPAVLLAKQRASLSFLLSGTIDKVLVKIGEKVEQDQVLMSLYNPNLDPTIASNLAQLESIKVQISQAKRDLLNLKELRKNNSTSRTAFEHKETELKDLQAKEKAIEAQIDLANANQQESMLRAPFDGVIVSVTKQVGEFVQVGQVVVVLNQQNTGELEVDISKQLHKDLHLNQLLTGTYEGDELQFRITELSQAADSQSHLMKVVLQLDEGAQGKIGQEIIIHFPQIYKNVYQLPLESVIDDGINKPYVFIAKDDSAHKSYIKPLFISNGQIVFSSNEVINDSVVIKGQSKLSSGMRLKQN